MNLHTLAANFFLLFASGYLVIKAIPHTKFRILFWKESEVFLVRLISGYLLYLVASVLWATYDACLITTALHNCTHLAWTQHFLQALATYVVPLHEQKVATETSSVTKTFNPILICSFTSVLLSLLITAIAKTLEKTSKTFQKTSKEQLYAPIVEHGGPLEEFFVTHRMSSQHFEPIMITLKNRKAYIGVVREISSKNSNKRSLSVIPLFSGHLDDKSLTFKKDIDYSILFKLLYIYSVNKEEIEAAKSKKNHIFVATLDGKNIEVDISMLHKINETGVIIDYEEILTARIWNNDLHKYFTNLSPEAPKAEISKIGRAASRRKRD